MEGGERREYVMAKEEKEKEGDTKEVLAGGR